MITMTFEVCKKNVEIGSWWEDENDIERLRLLKEYPFSTSIEGLDDEYDTMFKWLENQKNIDKDFIYDSIFYGKTDYCYHVAEYFFKRESDNFLFEKMIYTFCAIDSYGKTYRTEGTQNFIYFT